MATNVKKKGPIGLIRGNADFASARINKNVHRFPKSGGFCNIVRFIDDEKIPEGLPDLYQFVIAAAETQLFRFLYLEPAVLLVEKTEDIPSFFHFNVRCP
jgi:hypothetical protein